MREREIMEGGSNGTPACMMAFGENSNGGLCPMMMMMPLMTSTHHAHHHQHHPINPNPNAADTNSPFLIPLPPTNNHDQNRNTSSGSSFALDDHNNNPAGVCYFMDNNNDYGSSSVKAKIMAHPHYHRLLAAYVNCQKVKQEKVVNVKRVIDE